MSEEVLTHRIQITGPRWYRWLVAFPAHVSHRLAALILLPVIAGVVATDVFARYFLHAPIIWAQDVATLTRAGADFVSLREAVWNDPRGPAAAVAEAMTSIATAGAPVD